MGNFGNARCQALEVFTGRPRRDEDTEMHEKWLETSVQTTIAQHLSIDALLRNKFKAAFM